MATSNSVTPTDVERAELRAMLVGAKVPAEYVRALDEGHAIADVMGSVIASGVLTPTDTVSALLAEWTPLLSDDVDPMAAELLGAEFRAMMRSSAAALAGTGDLAAGGGWEPLRRLVEQAAGIGGPQALVMAQVLARTGPAEIRGVAAQAAGKLTATGLSDPAWMRTLGRPVFVSAYGYGDGAQEYLCVSFAYGGHHHGLVVVIDHQFGGVRDVFSTAEPDIVQEQYRLHCRADGLEFSAYTQAEAAMILTAALIPPPCPGDDQQRDDVDRHLDLLRARVALLMSTQF